MRTNLDQLKDEALATITGAGTPEALEAARVRYLGRKGIFSERMRELSQLAAGKRKTTGQILNAAKNEVAAALKNKGQALKESRVGKGAWLDVTLPGKKPLTGHLHPITQTIYEIEDIFHKLGFVRRRYPEVETDWYAFESLNMPQNHPARDEWETFYINDKTVITPHTSNGQVREMEQFGSPVRMINISRCGRRQSDLSHIPTFYQFEGLVVDQGINITHLKGTLDFFVREYFGKERAYRLRPTDFRFTEPSFEVDVTCGLCGGKGCRYCKAGWSELGGAGMVHPQVLKNGNLDPKKVAGFAFGWGVERVFMMRENLNIPDIRVLYQNDLRFLEQF